jgi:hypothetical protein
MSVINAHVAYAHVAFVAQHKDVEHTLNFTRDISEAQFRLKEASPRIYDVHVHAGIVVFHMRTISRKIDALVIELHRRIRMRHAGLRASMRTLRCQEALHQYNAATACCDPWDISLEATLHALDLAFECFKSIDDEMGVYEHMVRHA